MSDRLCDPLCINNFAMRKLIVVQGFEADCKCRPIHKVCLVHFFVPASKMNIQFNHDGLPSYGDGDNRR
jgi:hypothetical protein